MSLKERKYEVHSLSKSLSKNGNFSSILRAFLDTVACYVVTPVLYFFSFLFVSYPDWFKSF